MISMPWYPFRRSNSSPLSPDHHRYGQQRKDAHEHSENPKRLGGPVPLRPDADEKGPTEGNDGPKTCCNDEAVSGDCIVRLDKLSSLKSVQM